MEKVVTTTKEKVDEIKRQIMLYGSTRGTKISGLKTDGDFSRFLKNNADEFEDMKFVKREAKDEI
jgi:hypothetical protein